MNSVWKDIAKLRFKYNTRHYEMKRRAFVQGCEYAEDMMLVSLKKEKESHAGTTEQRDDLLERVDTIANLLGDQTEWTNLNDRGEIALTLLHELLKSEADAQILAAKAKDTFRRQAEIKLVPLAHEIHKGVLERAFPVWFFQVWKRKIPFVVLSRERFDNWTFNAVDHAVYRTSELFRKGRS